MDPEQIYQEVLQEEQQKGSAAPVAEGRAKAARQRTIHGSPHPKEPKWWSGSQPQFEGGTAPAAEPAVAAPEPAEPEPEPEPAAEPAAPAAESAPAPAPAAEEAPAAAPAGAASQPAAAAVAVAAPSGPTDLVPEARPAGVRHGVPTGNRLRPEDAVASEGQFDAQKAHYERRKLIDELVASGVPQVAAAETARPRAPVLALMYILIPLAAIGFLMSNDTAATEETGGDHGDTTSEVSSAIVAQGVAFDVETLTLTAGEAAELEFTNNDSGTPHNVAIYSNEADATAQENAEFDGEEFSGVASRTYEIPALEAGEYIFQCDVHPDMAGTVTVE